MRNAWEWLKRSLTLKGALVTGAALVCDPNILAVLPAGAARTAAVIGGVCTVFGLRRAMPAAPGEAAAPRAAPGSE